MNAMGKSIGSHVTVRRGSDNVAATAAGAGDNTLVTGQSVDRLGIGNPLSAVLAITFKTVLTEAKILTINPLIEHSDDNSSFTTLNDPAVSTVATGAGGGSTERGTLEINLDLSGCKRYIRAKYTPDLDASGTDTAELAATWVFGGSQEQPA